jgi:hypothetical protein
MLEDYVEKWPAPRPENFLYMLRSGMMGWLTVMMDTTYSTPEQHAIAKDEFQLYKKKLRPLIRNADLCHISSRPDGVHWGAIEYFNPETSQGVLYAFRGSTKSESAHSFVLNGITAASTYQLHFHDHSSRDRRITGRQLLTSGIKLTLPNPLSSELVFFEKRS